MVAGEITVHELLLAEGHELARIDGIDALYTACCAERPAASALQTVVPFQ